MSQARQTLVLLHKGLQQAPGSCIQVCTQCAWILECHLPISKDFYLVNLRLDALKKIPCITASSFGKQALGSAEAWTLVNIDSLPIGLSERTTALRNGNFSQTRTGLPQAQTIYALCSAYWAAYPRDWLKPYTYSDCWLASSLPTKFWNPLKGRVEQSNLQPEKFRTAQSIYKLLY